MTDNNSADITATLANGGLPADAIAYWWTKPRKELHGVAPSEAILDSRLRDDVAKLAKSDVEHLRHFGEQELLRAKMLRGY